MTKLPRVKMTAPRAPTDMDRRLGRLIRERRLERNLRQEDLARALNVTQHQLQKYEVGDNRISASRLVDCANALDVPISWFFQPDSRHAKVDNTLTSEEGDLLRGFRKLPLEAQSQLLQILAVLLGQSPKRPKQS